MTEYNFTTGVRKALAIAREESIEYRHGVVAPEHIVLALVGKGADRDMKRLIDVIGLSLEDLSTELRAELEEGAEEIELGELPYTESGQEVVRRSLAISKRNGDRNVGTDHLLLAAVEVADGPLSGMFRARGFSSSRLENALLESRSVGRARPWWKVWG